MISTAMCTRHERTYSIRIETHLKLGSDHLARATPRCGEVNDYQFTSSLGQSCCELFLQRVQKNILKDTLMKNIVNFSLQESRHDE